MLALLLLLSLPPSSPFSPVAASVKHIIRQSDSNTLLSELTAAPFSCLLHWNTINTYTKLSQKSRDALCTGHFTSKTSTHRGFTDKSKTYNISIYPQTTRFHSQLVEYGSLVVPLRFKLGCSTYSSSISFAHEWLQVRSSEQ